MAALDFLSHTRRICRSAHRSPSPQGVLCSVLPKLMYHIYSYIFNVSRFDGIIFILIFNMLQTSFFPTPESKHENTLNNIVYCIYSILID